MARGAKKDKGDLTHDTKNELSEDQRQALFFQHKRQIAALKEKVGSATSDLRNAYKVAKAEGFPKKDFDFAFKLEDDADDEAISERRRQAEIAKWLGHPIGTQADLFAETSIDRRPISETSYEEGKRAAMNNEVLKPPHGAGTEAYTRYVEGWHEGDAIRASLAKEQEDGASLLRMNEEPDGADDFDDAADGGEAAEASDGGDWPDDRDVEANAEEREPAEVL